ncbi:MAG: hypothetical protein WBN57_05270 [Gammaproteobacteria bacterium]
MNSRKMACCLLCIATLAAAGISGCATKPRQPVLYPNNHLKSVGAQKAEQDIAACFALARASSVNQRKDGDIGRKTVGGAAIGGASAGAWGAVRDSNDVGNRALAGAAAGAAAGAVRGGLQMTETSPLFMNFVNKCLSEKNYSVIGWQ